MQIDPSWLSKATSHRLILGTAIAMVVMTLAAVCARCYVKLRIVRVFGKEDWLMVFSMLAFLGYFALLIWGCVAGGIGRHILTLTTEEITIGGEAILLAYLFYSVSLACFKISIGLLLVRLKKHSKLWVYSLYTAIAATIITAIFAFFWLLFQCWPVQWFWAAVGREAHCRNSSSTINSIYAFSAVDILVDWIFALMPIPMILKLKMDKANKSSSASVMAMGILASLATIVRCAYIHKISSTEDAFWDYNKFLVWTNLELGLGNTIACLLTLRPLLAKFGLIKQQQSNARTKGGVAYQAPAAPRRASMPRMASWFRLYQDEAEGGSDDAVIMADHDKVYHSSASDLESGTGTTEIHNVSQNDTLDSATPLSNYKRQCEHISPQISPPSRAYTPPMHHNTRSMDNIGLAMTTPSSPRVAPHTRTLSDPISRSGSPRSSISTRALHTQN